MLHNIFLFKGKKIRDLEDLNIYSYPNEVISINNKILVNKIIKEHDKEEEIQSINSNHYVIDEPIAQYINDLNLYTICINRTIIIGLIFENEDNPYDYMQIFKELVNEVLNNGNVYSFDDEMEVDNILISMFIDIRRFGDEVIENYSEIDYYYERETFFKAFLFGIDEVGKSSLVRRLKTGEFNENYFTPTRKFNIEYLPMEEEGLLAVWDMPGQKGFRSKWLIGLQESNVIIYMIDVANQRRFEESKNEFWNVLNNDQLNEIPLLILGNKIDLIKSSKNGYETQFQNLRRELIEFYDFEKITNRNWNFLFTSVKTNYNIDNVIPSIYDLISP
ncbi:MAG: GTP-binding protein [Promethearchaeota archaeon]|nr:MAG: GTP-binding protein [Candidatus Lokiarchaeota archaeon]